MLPSHAYWHIKCDIFKLSWLLSGCYIFVFNSNHSTKSKSVSQKQWTKIATFENNLWCCAALTFTLPDFLAFCVCVCVRVCVQERDNSKVPLCYSNLLTRNYHCSITSTRLIITIFQTALIKHHESDSPSESSNHTPAPTHPKHLTHLRALSHCQKMHKAHWLCITCLFRYLLKIKSI